MIDYRNNNKWIVYIHISPSNKYYVGITSRKHCDRWRKGKGYIKNKYFYRAIQKYGWDNFNHEIIAEHLTKDEACDMERALIRIMKSNDYHYGYNICSGGEGATGLFGEKNPNYGNKWSDEKRKKMSMYMKSHPSIVTVEGQKRKSESMKAKWKNEEYRKNNSGKNAPCYGCTGDKHPMYGKISSNAKKVICLNTNGVFNSALEASKNKVINHYKLCMCCRGERNSCGKDDNNNPLKWKYFDKYLEENNLTNKEAHESLFFVD